MGNNILIAEYHSRVCDLIFNIYNGATYSLEILMGRGIFAHGRHTEGQKIFVRFGMSKENEITIPSEIAIYKDYVTLIGSNEMDDLEDFENIVRLTPPTKHYIKPFQINLPQPTIFINKLLNRYSVFEVNIQSSVFQANVNTIK